jgi:hypothetical protein
MFREDWSGVYYWQNYDSTNDNFRETYRAYISITNYNAQPIYTDEYYLDNSQNDRFRAFARMWNLYKLLYYKESKGWPWLDSAYAQTGECQRFDINDPTDWRGGCRSKHPKFIWSDDVPQDIVNVTNSQAWLKKRLDEFYA